MKIKKHRIIFDGEYYRCQEWKLWNPFWKNIGGFTHPVQSLYQTLDAARHDLEKYIGVHSERKIVAEY